jgi:hypothetical protein
MALFTVFADTSIKDVHPFRLLICFLAVLMVVYLAQAILGRRKNDQASALPELPWVGRSENAWFLTNTRARFWTMLNYEEALRIAYEKVCVGLFDKNSSEACLFGDGACLRRESRRAR